MCVRLFRECSSANQISTRLLCIVMARCSNMWICFGGRKLIRNKFRSRIFRTGRDTLKQSTNHPQSDFIYRCTLYTHSLAYYLWCDMVCISNSVRVFCSRAKATPPRTDICNPRQRYIRERVFAFQSYLSHSSRRRADLPLSHNVAQRESGYCSWHVFVCGISKVFIWRPSSISADYGAHGMALCLSRSLFSNAMIVSSIYHIFGFGNWLENSI